MITYLIAIDMAHDGSFSTNDDDISMDVLSARWRLGMPDAYANMSGIGQAEITVNNRNQVFSSDENNQLIGKRLRIQSNDGTTTRTHFTGMIVRVIPQTSNQGERLATLYVVGREAELQTQLVRLPLMTNITADDVIQEVVEQVAWQYEDIASGCVIGESSIGSSWIFPDEVITTTFDEGKSTFEFLSSAWSADVRAVDAIEQITEAENGRFFFNREGEAVFYNRHHLLGNDAIVASFSDDAEHIAYEVSTVVNQVEMTITQRVIGASNQALWTLSNPIKLVRQQTRRLVVRYQVDGESVGAIELEPLLAGHHYTIHSNSQGVGTDYSAQVAVYVEDATLNSATISVSNLSNQDLYLTSLTLHGTPLITGDDITLIKDDPVSALVYGKQVKHLSSSIITDIGEVDGIINWELQRYRQPSGRIREFHTNTRTHPTETLSLSLFDRIQIEASQPEHIGRYYIISEEHTVDKGGARHRVCWQVEPSEVDRFFVIGTHSIGDEGVILVPR